MSQMINSKDVIEINKEITGSDSILNLNMLESAISSYGYYESIEEQIASIFRGIVKNHAFNDGNKRTGLILLLTLCQENDIDLNKSDVELANLTIDIAKNKYEVKDIANKIFG